MVQSSSHRSVPWRGSRTQEGKIWITVILGTWKRPLVVYEVNSPPQNCRREFPGCPDSCNLQHRTHNRCSIKAAWLGFFSKAAKESFQKSALFTPESLSKYVLKAFFAQQEKKFFFPKSRRRKGGNLRNRGDIWVQGAQVGPHGRLGRPSTYSPSFCPAPEHSNLSPLHFFFPETPPPHLLTQTPQLRIQVGPHTPPLQQGPTSPPLDLGQLFFTAAGFLRN